MGKRRERLKNLEAFFLLHFENLYDIKQMDYFNPAIDSSISQAFDNFNRGYFDGGHGLGLFSCRPLSDRGRSDFIDYLYAFRNVTKNNVVFGKLGICMYDEKLASVCIGAGIGHSHGSTRIFAGKRFIVKCIPRPAGAIPLRISALDHKPGNDAVKRCIVIKICTALSAFTELRTWFFSSGRPGHSPGRPFLP